MSAALRALVAALPAGTVDTDAELVDRYSTDSSGIPGERGAIALVRPGSTAEVQTVMRIAGAHGVPVSVRGAGTGLSGGSLAVAGGIVLSTERLNRILEIHPGDQVAVVQPGVITADVDRAAAEHGLRYAPDPASSEISSIGGNIATNAGGLRCAKYGVTRDSVLALEVVLPSGALIRTGHRSIKGVTGFDLVGLFVGSEGTLGVIVSATLRLRPIPVRTETVVVFAPSLIAAGTAVDAIVRSGVQPSILELVDEANLRSLDAARGTDLLASGRAMLLVQTDGYGAALEADALTVLLAGLRVTVLRVHGGEADWYIGLRRGARALGSNLWAKGSDAAVPGSRLVATLQRVEAIALEHGLGSSVRAHAGDGNVHAVFTAERVPGEVAPPASLARALDDLTRAVLDSGGTVSGEHGIGVVKRAWLAAELGDDQLALQRAIKAAVDPAGLLAADSFLAG